MIVNKAHTLIHKTHTLTHSHKLHSHMLSHICPGLSLSPTVDSRAKSHWHTSIFYTGVYKVPISSVSSCIFITLQASPAFCNPWPLGCSLSYTACHECTNCVVSSLLDPWVYPFLQNQQLSWSYKSYGNFSTLLSQHIGFIASACWGLAIISLSKATDTLYDSHSQKST